MSTNAGVLLDIQVVPENFLQAEKELQNVKTLLEEYRRFLENSFAQMRANWNGRAANTFEEKTAKIFLQYKDLNMKLEELSKDIKSARTAMETLDSNLSRSI